MNTPHINLMLVLTYIILTEKIYSVIMKKKLPHELTYGVDYIDLPPRSNVRGSIT